MSAAARPPAARRLRLVREEAAGVADLVPDLLGDDEAVDGWRASAPAAAPLDDVLRMRVTVLAEQYLDPTPALAAHLDVLDTRGAWYAEQVLTTWSANQPDAFWGLVNHYVRTHFTDGPAPLDLPAWVAAGPPEDEGLRPRWDDVARRIPDLAVDRAATRSSSGASDLVATEAAVTAWPAEHWGRFIHAYALVECLLADHQIQIPILTD